MAKARQLEFRAVNAEGTTVYHVSARTAELAERLIRIEQRRRGESGWTIVGDRLNSMRSSPPKLHDTDSGLGIGGISRYVEPIVVPSLQAAERYIQRTKRARRCRRCHQTDLDGAIFSTAPDSGLCDDCFDS